MPCVPDPLVVVSWLWRGVGRKSALHTAEKVNILRAMVARNLKVPHEFVCVTDMPEGVDRDIRIIPLWRDLRDEGYCMVRLGAFRPEMREIIGPRFVWLDLDIVVTGDLTPLFDTPEDFKISGVELRAQPYNGSIVLMDAGARRQVYDAYDRERFLRVKAEKTYGGTDQAWIAVCLGEKEAVWTEHDGIYNYRDHIHPDPPAGTGGALPENARIISFNGQFDPSMPGLQKKSPWIMDHWRR